MAQIQFSLIEKIKIVRPEHLLTPHPRTSDDISYLPYSPPPHPHIHSLKVNVICVSPLKHPQFSNVLTDATAILKDVE